MKSGAILLRLIAVTLPALALAAPAPRTSEPTGQVVGFYSNGALVNPAKIPSEGKGFVHLFEGRNHGYGSQGLVDLLVSAAAEISERFPGGERLQIGDLSAYYGGPIERHASHQNGLDADVVFYRLSHTEQSGDYFGDGGFRETFVAATETQVTDNFDARRTWELIKVLDRSGRLQRIYMHPAIKKALVAQARALRESKRYSRALGRIGLLNNHDDHMHVRLSCPSSSPACGRAGAPRARHRSEPSYSRAHESPQAPTHPLSGDSGWRGSDGTPHFSPTVDYTGTVEYPSSDYSYPGINVDYSNGGN